MKKTYKLTESKLRNIIKEAVKSVLSEVTDYGNNIFGSAQLNPTYKEQFGVDKDDYYTLRSLISEILDKLDNYTDRIQNYTNKGVSLYLYGTIDERQNDIREIQNFSKSKGFNAIPKEVTRWSGYNQYTAIKIDFEKQ